MLTRLIAAGALLASASGAGASVLITLDHVSGGTKSFDWVYDVRLQPGEFLQAGGFFTVYDFSGLESAKFTPEAAFDSSTGRVWDLTTPSTGQTPPNLAPTDSGALKNVSVTLSSGPNIVPDQTGPSVLLGQLTLTNETDVLGPRINFTSQTNVQGNRLPDFTIGTVAGPVPEPATIGLLGFGLAAAGALGWRRKAGAERG